MKLTILLISLTLTAALAIAADEPRTIVTLKGERFEKARVSEVTPATITIVHASGVATVPLSEFGSDIRTEFHYDPAKAKAWLDQLEENERRRRAQEAAQRAADERQEAQRRQKEADALDRITRHIDNGGHLLYDPISRQFYDPDEAARKRSYAIREYQRTARRRKP